KTVQPRVCVETECKDNTKIPESPPVRANFDGWPAESAPARACGRSLLLQPRGGEGRAAPEGFRPAGGRAARTGEGLCPSAGASGGGGGGGFAGPQGRAAGIIGGGSADQIGEAGSVRGPPAGPGGYFPRGRGRRVMAPPGRPVGHSNGLSEAGRGGAGEASPF